MSRLGLSLVMSDLLTPNGEAWRWAGIHCSSSPEPKPNIVTEDEDNN